MPYPMDDVVIVLPGIMGSTLHRQGVPVWEPSRGALIEALTSLFRSVKTLQLPKGIGDEHPQDGVKAVGLMPDIRLPFGIWTFDLGYDALLGFLRRTFELIEAPPGSDRPVNLVVFPYDWRLSSRYNGERLRTVAERALDRWRGQGGRYTGAKLVFIAHSMGGLVARWYLDRLGGAELTRKLITLGTPHRGALRALEQLVNGVCKGPGPFKVTLTDFAHSLPSLHQLLPEYACIDHGGELAKTTELILPELVTAMVSDAMAFHDQIDAGRVDAAQAGGPRYQLHPICGFKQPTWTTAKLVKDRVAPSGAINDQDLGGDATVPRLAAVPPDLALDDAVIRHIPDNHGGLVHNQNVFDELEGILTASRVRYRGGEIGLKVEMDEILDPGEPLRARATPLDHEPIALDLVIADNDGRRLDAIRMTLVDGAHTTKFPLPGPGVYQVTVQGAGAAIHRTIPVKTAILAWPPEASFDPMLLS